VKITVDPAYCTGHGRCYVVSPGLFSSDDEGFCAERGPTREVPVGLEAAAKLAVDSCPEGAISLAD
jgi:ferredoxin